ncbi:glmZ(sRNA)-inactivating NTPase [Oxobacter pfennigii]|uniref:GlmZ(SRNA)-inactivating NTPase n=1 Tax=Oxobacter pfennigii TaxID=36849 RepID=A0A0P8WLT5_9CLOT|nr:RNase adapter RapZ [Oxobacter pfennigii]KPU43436.1 glmZ(sRNA)-inactivating NTPase [Oxobacter pfennigii]
MRFVIVTGLSGAGKSQAMKSLEDLGFFCVDNLPPALLPKFADLCFQTQGKIDRVALVIDIRGGSFFDDIFESLNQLKMENFNYEILFLDSSDDVLIKRFKESRRSHPLAPDGRILDGINEERIKLTELKSKADNIIDTSNLTPRQLKEEIIHIFVEGQKFEGIIVSVVSFGFKYGIPLDSDLVFDVRFLSNPYYVEVLKRQSGKDEPVKEYVMRWPETREFLDKVVDMAEFLIPYYIKEGKSHLVISFGCTGGRHRSVVIANNVYEALKKNGHRVIIDHRDISEDIEESKR